jgi:hypothetical protein
MASRDTDMNVARPPYRIGCGGRRLALVGGALGMTRSPLRVTFGAQRFFEFVRGGYGHVAAARRVVTPM